MKNEMKNEEKKQVKMIRCCICGKMIVDDFGCNPYPVKKRGRCCHECDGMIVIPTRIRLASLRSMKEELTA